MTATTPPKVTDTTGDAAADTIEPLTVEMLVEEVSIDGMCGVY